MHMAIPAHQHPQPHTPSETRHGTNVLEEHVHQSTMADQSQTRMGYPREWAGARPRNSESYRWPLHTTPSAHVVLYYIPGALCFTIVDLLSILCAFFLSTVRLNEPNVVALDNYNLLLYLAINSMFPILNTTIEYIIIKELPVYLV